MDTNVNYTLVGAFVITLITAIVLTIIWLSSGLSLGEDSNYLMYSQESVSGLNIDAQVEYNGVNVGSVKEIDIVKDNPRLVKVLMSVKSSTPITKGTVATLSTRGLTGVVFIALKDTGNDLTPIVTPKGYPYPVIPTRPSLFLRLDTALQKLTKSLQSVSETFSNLFDKENLKSIKDVLNNLNKVTGTLADNTQKLNVIIENTSRASAQLSPLILNGSNAMRTLGNQTLPETYRLLSNLNDITRTLSEVSLQLKQNPSILIRGAAPLPPGPGERR